MLKKLFATTLLVSALAVAPAIAQAARCILATPTIITPTIIITSITTATTFIIIIIDFASRALLLAAARFKKHRCIGTTRRCSNLEICADQCNEALLRKR